MRIWAAVFVAIFCLISLACGVVMQPAVQGEWSNVHSDKDKTTQNARPESDKPSGEK